ncbi:MAG: sulfurtransferase TusA family protein [Pseudomonadota bacterium]
MCPLPVLKLRKRLTQVSPGDVVILLTDDPAAVLDVPHFCTEAGHRLDSAETDAAPYRFTVMRKSDPA